MKQKVINLYEFHELTTEQQAEVIEKNRDIEVELFNANDETYTQPIHDAGFLNPVIYCDLSYCQGSGACFDCNEFDYDKLLKDWQHTHKKWIIDIIKSHYQGYIKCNQYGYHYSHSKTRYFILSEGFYNTYYYLEGAVNNAIEHIEKLRYKLSEQLTEQLYNDLEYLRSDEVVKDCLISNEYYFNGETLEIEY